MKYWRGYLVAAILAFCGWGLQQFAASHWVLVDMIYPYVTRMVQTFLAQWSESVALCVWQLVLLVLGVLLAASIVLMIVLRWNPIQWFGWVLAAGSLVFLLHTGIYGLNNYAAPLADDIRLKVSDYTVNELEKATIYYRDQANALAKQANRDGAGELKYPAFSALAEQAGEGFQTLTYREFSAAFAGSTVPVKELGWSHFFTDKGMTGFHVALTGEAAVNPETPAVGLPFAMCRQMAKRMCIANEQDAALAAFLACRANSQKEYQYAGYFMAYRYCISAMESRSDSEGKAALAEIRKGESQYLQQDLAAYNGVFDPKEDEAALTADVKTEENGPQRSSITDLLVSLYIQEIILPQQMEDEPEFDPMDETQVDLSGIANAVPATTGESNG